MVRGTRLTDVEANKNVTLIDMDTCGDVYVRDDDGICYVIERDKYTVANVKTFKVYTHDNNVMMFDGENMYDVLSYVLFVKDYDATDIRKIEEIHH